MQVSEPLIPAQRRHRIREYLQRHQIVRSATLSEILGVSEATVRRDLVWLEQQGEVERTHGGAVLTQRLPTEPAYASSVLAHPEEKHWIGRAAAALVEPGDTIFVNSGTTTSELLRHLRARGLTDLTVVTNNVAAALESREPGFELILLGGSFRPRSNSVSGRFAAGLIRQVYADKAFIGVDGISLHHGCTTPINSEAEVAGLMIERTQGPVIIVADHSKWGVVSNFEVTPLSTVNTLVTDEGLAPEWRTELRARSIEVRIGAANGPDGRRQAGP
ncbi:MAG: DeoR/GlpR family DNA-binding transcription regulator [Anaerolineales bacterium]